MIRKLDHVGIVVADMEAALAFYRDTLGLPLTEYRHQPERKQDVAIFRVGEVDLEVIHPFNDESAAGKYFAKNGAGLYHIGMETDNVDGELRRLEHEGVRLVDTTPRRGTHTRFGFVHPKSTKGILIELSTPYGGTTDDGRRTTDS
jgi:methylmalonyl-CoA/ethylmalonyl-CoA epimerase